MLELLTTRHSCIVLLYMTEFYRKSKIYMVKTITKNASSLCGRVHNGVRIAKNDCANSSYLALFELFQFLIVLEPQNLY